MGNNPRQQLYKLNFGSVITPEFWTPDQSDDLIYGISSTGSSKQLLGVNIGGTNNNAYNDQQLIQYTAATKKLTSSGLSAAALIALIPYSQVLTQNVKSITLTPTWSGGGPYTLASAVVASSTSNFIVGETLYLIGGTFASSKPASVTVATLSGSAVATVTVNYAGSYTVRPGNPVTASGTGITTNAYGTAPNGSIVASQVLTRPAGTSSWVWMRAVFSTYFLNPTGQGSTIEGVYILLGSDSAPANYPSLVTVNSSMDPAVNIAGFQSTAPSADGSVPVTFVSTFEGPVPAAHANDSTLIVNLYGSQGNPPPDFGGAINYRQMTTIGYAK